VDPSVSVNPIAFHLVPNHASAANVGSTAMDNRSEICPNRGIRPAVRMGPQSIEHRAVRLIEIRRDSVKVDRAIGYARSNTGNGCIGGLERPVSGRWFAVVQVAEAGTALERRLVYWQRVPRPPFVFGPGAGRKGVAVLNSDGHRPTLSYVDVLAAGNFGDLCSSAMSKTL
jgi:hypothetical protein